MPKHRQSGRRGRHRRSQYRPAHRYELSPRHASGPLSRQGQIAALGVLAVAVGTAGAIGHGVPGTGAPSAAVTASAAGHADPQAASRDLNRLGATPPPPAGIATARPSPRPTPSPTASRTPDMSRTAAARPAPDPVPPGCAGYTGNELIACRLLPSFGFPASQMAPLVKLWNGESGWRTTATNPSSGAYGIPQSLPAGKMAAAGRDWRTNPATQIRWGLGYIRATYGSPAGAWAAWQSRSPHWY